MKAQRLSADSVRIIVSDDGGGMSETDSDGGLRTRMVRNLVDSVVGTLTYSTSEVGTVAILDVPKRSAEPQSEA